MPLQGFLLGSQGHGLLTERRGHPSRLSCEWRTSYGAPENLEVSYGGEIVNHMVLKFLELIKLSNRLSDTLGKPQTVGTLSSQKVQ